MGIEPLLQSFGFRFFDAEEADFPFPDRPRDRCSFCRTGSTGEPVTCGSGRQTKSGEGTCGGHGGKTGEFSDLEFSKTETTTWTGISLRTCHRSVILSLLTNNWTQVLLRYVLRCQVWPKKMRVQPDKYYLKTSLSPRVPKNQLLSLGLLLLLLCAALQPLANARNVVDKAAEEIGEFELEDK